VAIAGGDGTLHLAVQVLAGTDVTLGILPQGTANNFAMALGIQIHAPYARAVGMAAEASPDAAPSPELNRAMDSPVETFAYWLDYAIVIVIIFDMIMKPFGL